MPAWTTVQVQDQRSKLSQNESLKKTNQELQGSGKAFASYACTPYLVQKNRKTREEEKEKIKASLMQVPALGKQRFGC